MLSEIYQMKFSESGFNVLSAIDGVQALGVLKKEKVDVVMSDLMMPKMDGFELTKNIRSNFDPKIKIIITSNLSQKEDKEKVMSLGVSGFIAKSNFTPTELVKEVIRLLKENEK